MTTTTQTRTTTSQPVKVEIVNQVDDEPIPGHRRTVRRWLITAGGYRAEIQECDCGLRRQIGVKYRDREPSGAAFQVEEVFTAPKIECLCDYTQGRCTQATKRDRDRYCHGWHQQRVDRLAAALAAASRPRRPRPPRRQQYAAGAYVQVPGWPDRRDVPGATHEQCACESCAATLALFA